MPLPVSASIGLTAELMDELARRAKFTWRDSFGIFRDPGNETWTDVLVWGIDTYDVSMSVCRGAISLWSC